MQSASIGGGVGTITGRWLMVCFLLGVGLRQDFLFVKITYVKLGMLSVVHEGTSFCPLSCHQLVVVAGVVL